ncbi:hypothetical protein BKA80DRAFT_268085 [Phyllosticta citrichinensis]
MIAIKAKHCWLHLPQHLASNEAVRNQKPLEHHSCFKSHHSCIPHWPMTGENGRRKRHCPRSSAVSHQSIPSTRWESRACLFAVETSVESTSNYRMHAGSTA